MPPVGCEEAEVFPPSGVAHRQETAIGSIDSGICDGDGSRLPFSACARL